VGVLLDLVSVPMGRVGVTAAFLVGVNCRAFMAIIIMGLGAVADPATDGWGGVAAVVVAGTGVVADIAAAVLRLRMSGDLENDRVAVMGDAAATAAARGGVRGLFLTERAGDNRPSPNAVVVAVAAAGTAAALPITAALLWAVG
jgi:hypothetical protein